MLNYLIYFMTCPISYYNCTVSQVVESFFVEIYRIILMMKPFVIFSKIVVRDSLLITFCDSASEVDFAIFNCLKEN